MNKREPYIFIIALSVAAKPIAAPYRENKRRTKEGHPCESTVLSYMCSFQQLLFCLPARERKRGFDAKRRRQMAFGMMSTYERSFIALVTDNFYVSLLQ